MEDVADIQFVSALELQDASGKLAVSAQLFKEGIFASLQGFASLNQTTANLSHSLSEISIQIKSIGVEMASTFGAGSVMKKLGLAIGTADAARPQIPVGQQTIIDTMTELVNSMKDGGTSATGGGGTAGMSKVPNFFAPAIDAMKGAFEGFGEGGFTGAIGGGAGGLVGGFGKVLKPFGDGFKSLGPQMMAMSLVMKPVSAFLGALLEPLEIITDMFGAFGSILSVALIPLTKEIADVLLPIMPILVSALQILTPVIQLLSIPLGLLGEGIQVLSGLITGLDLGIGDALGGFADRVTASVDALVESNERLIVSTDEAAAQQVAVDSQEIAATSGKQNLRFNV